ncbi:hypothetical protein J5F27_09930 [Schleiferilactobacillus harbinensis]|jgi:hypothetical protein|uniref:Uncharacterized protein n=1 Tax=Schleiferilactobacillus harbinensis TaxID=304207 RepID=A0A5P8M629_9LACO|nr:hypothetical protein [Schleiferilactobacillus harbinensis]MBO3092238.1 hypothetical protein [Schleiferilactobacillus harbinensis]QFR23962.1 hypothetical protein D1010_11445 [Schleiferilactobacillus harbinensis]
MMNPQQLNRPTWEQLTGEQQHLLFTQILRYFVNPLLPTTEIAPVRITVQGKNFASQTVMIAGQRYIFVPGQLQAQLGYQVTGQEVLTPQLWDDGNAVLEHPDLPAMALTTNGQRERYLTDFTTAPRTADIPPLLVAQQPLPIDQRSVGLYTPGTDDFSGDVVTFKKIRQTVGSQLRQAPRAIVTPEMSIYFVPTAVLGEYQLRVAETLPPMVLTQTLARQGFSVLAPDEYEYVVSGGQTTLFPWGAQGLTDLPPVIPNRFGIRFSARQYTAEMTTDPLTWRGGWPVSGGQKKVEAQLPFSAFYDSGRLPGFGDLPLPQQVYHQVIRVSFDDDDR